MTPTFLKPERTPYASVVIIPAAERRLEEAQRADFRALLRNPATGPMLDKMIADNERLDDELQAERDAEDERDRWDADNNGNACSSRCGFCGRCS